MTPLSKSMKNAEEFREFCIAVTSHKCYWPPNAVISYRVTKDHGSMSGTLCMNGTMTME